MINKIRKNNSILSLLNVLSYIQPTTIKYKIFNFDRLIFEYPSYTRFELLLIYRSVINIVKNYIEGSKYKNSYIYNNLNSKFLDSYARIGFKDTSSGGKNDVLVISQSIFDFPIVECVSMRGEKYSSNCIFHRKNVLKTFIIPRNWEKKVYDNGMDIIGKKLVLDLDKRNGYHDIVWCEQSRGFEINTFKGKMYVLNNGKIIFKNKEKLVIGKDIIYNIADFIHNKICESININYFDANELYKFINLFGCSLCEASYSINKSNKICCFKHKLKSCSKFTLDDECIDDMNKPTPYSDIFLRTGIDL